MSNLGISIVGSVAQGNLQAQQIDRALHRQRTDTTADARRVHERLVAHVDALEEGDESNQLSNLRVDEQLPDHQPSHDQSAEKNESDSDVPAEAPDIAATAEPAKDGLYRHLDVTG